MSVDLQEGLSDSVLGHYRETLAFRKTDRAMVSGEFAFLQTNQDLLAFTRKHGEEELLFVFNLTRKRQEFEIPATIEVREQLAMPGFKPRFDGATVVLEPLDAFCGKL